MGILDNWVEDLLAHKKSGAEVARAMRAHYASDCSLRSKLSVVRTRFMNRIGTAHEAAAYAAVAALRRRQEHAELPLARRQKAELEASTLAGAAMKRVFAQLSAHAKRLSGGECAEKLRSFLAAPLHVQVILIRRHASKHFCFDEEGVEASFQGTRTLLKVLHDLRVTRKVAESCVTQSVATRLRRNEEMMTIADGDAVIQIAAETLRDESATLPEMFLALCLLSGRRFAEIANGRSTFKPVKSSKYATLFEGQLKTRSKKAYTIPLLVTYSTFSDGVRELRRRQGLGVSASEKGETGVALLENEKVSARYQGNTPAALDNMFPELKRTHDLRAAYATLVYATFDCGSMTFNRVTMQVLGHATLSQSLAYNTVRVQQVSRNFGKLPLG